MIPTVLALLALSAGLRLRGWDTPVFLFLNAWGVHAPAVWAGLSVIGLGLSAFLLLSATSSGTDPRRLQLVAALIWCFPIGGLLTHGFKRVFSTPRPQGVLPLDQLQVIGEPLLYNSLPSGHAITAMAVVWLWTWSRRGHPVWKLLVWVIGLAVMLSRITTAAHWPSDVAAGAAAGLVAAQLSLVLTQRWSAARWLARPLGQWVLALGQIGGGVAMALAHTGYPMAQPVQWGLAAVGVVGGLERLWQWMRSRGRPAPSWCG